jgi:hypothetical protein
VKIALIKKIINTVDKMTENQEYAQLHSQALAARQSWLEKTELPRLKEEFRTFGSSFVNIYQILLKKGFLQEDPYKQETKVGELTPLPSGSFTEAKKIDELSIRLSNYDNQLDFLVNFYQFSSEFLTLDRIKRILALVRYIDWAHFSNASPSPNTKALAEVLAVVKSGGMDQISLTIISESAVNLEKATDNVMKILKTLADYQRECIKAQIRDKITGTLEFGADAGVSKKAEILAQIKKKYPSVMGGIPFYPEIVEELISEDYTPQGKALREKILKNMAPLDVNPKVQKKQVSFKAFLIDGFHILGSTGPVITDILEKIEENNETMQSLKKGFWEKMRQLLQQVMNKPPDPVLYKLQYIDPVRGTSVREDVDYYKLRTDLEKRVRVLAGFSARTAVSRLDSMGEEQLSSLLDRGIGEIQRVHKTLAALDDYFKVGAPPEIRDKIKGVKPELAAIKNAIVNANQKRYEYSAQKEEAEQFKRLGIDA